MLNELFSFFTEPSVDCNKYSVINALLDDDVGARIIAETLLLLDMCSVADVIARMNPPFPM